MLLTIPWFLSIYGGRVNINSAGNASYKDSPKLRADNTSACGSLDTAGVAVTGGVKTGAKMMLMSTVSYLLLQGPGLKYAAFTGVGVLQPQAINHSSSMITVTPYVPSPHHITHHLIFLSHLPLPPLSCHVNIM